MMNLPHLSFLRSFEAAARHLSFTSAAEELNCTQAAVSNHVRSLEDFLRRPLFVRHPRSLSLTDVGTAYLQSVRHALQEIDLATQSLTLQVHKREVVVSCPVSLAESWLAEVIASFREVHPDIDLTVHGTVWNDVETNVSDISIVVSHVDDTPSDLRLLWEERLTLVCAPDYQPGGAPLTQPEQLHQADLIHILGRPIYWGLAEEALGLEGLNLKGGLRTSGNNLALELAVLGLGCVMLPSSVVQRYLDRGLLVEPFDIEVKSPWCYFTRCKERSATPSVKAFYAWMLQAADVG